MKNHNGNSRRSEEITRDEFIALLRAEIERVGGQNELARRMHISITLLSLILSGEREPRGAVLDYFGIEKIVIYRKK